MSQLSRLVRIARTDFSYFFRTKWLMAVLISLSLSDMLVMGLVYGRLIGPAYFRFLVPGIVVVGLFSAATDTGRRVWLALREGVVQYYMTLPIRTGGLVGAYIISGGLGGIVYSGLLLLIASIVVPPQGILNAIVLIPFLFILSTGIAGLAAFFASVSRRGEMYWVYAQALQVSMVTISTVFYSAQTITKYLPAPIAMIAEYNPLSLAAGVLRDSAFNGGPLDTSALGNLLAASLPLAALGGVAYWIILRTIRLKGKPENGRDGKDRRTIRRFSQSLLSR
ncbi:ABC transporter permease [Candidatus Bathyarchaeota archaeon]|nr:MAG: ABC transporter permease [Candidatus Bathyarchaeota archaeon]